MPQVLPFIGDIERAWRWPAGTTCAQCGAVLRRRPARCRRLDPPAFYCRLRCAVAAAMVTRHGRHDA